MRLEKIKMTDNDYFAAEGLSNSFLNEFDKAPICAFTPKESSESMDDGKLFHSYLLDPPIEFSEKCIIIDRINRNTNEFKKIKAENPDKIIRFYDEIEYFKIMKKNVLSLVVEHELLSDILPKCENEIAIFADLFGYQFKCKIDSLYVANNTIMDLKCTESIEKFPKKIETYKYYRQQAIYKALYSQFTGLPAQDIHFYFIAVESVFPFGSCVFEIDADYEAYGMIDVLNLVSKYSEWIARGSDKTEIYQETFKIVDKPKWLI